MTPADHDQSAQPGGPAASTLPPAPDAPAVPAPDAGFAAARAQEAALARRRAMSRWLGAALILAVIVIVALAAALRHQQQQLDAFGREAARRLDEIVARTDAASSQAGQALAQAQRMQGQLAALDERARKTEDQQKTLAQSYRELISGNDEAMLVDVEQGLLLASEQLQLAGRVPTAIAALQLAEARLARAGRPAFMPAQQAIARDMNRLQGLPLLDLAATAARIDGLISALDTLPLASVGNNVRTTPSDPGGAAEPPAQERSAANAPAGDAQWWRNIWEPVRDWSARVRASTMQELRNLVQVRRIEAPDALLLAPEQAVWLRTNATLRLLEARIALLSREPELWRADLDAAEQAVRRYADPEAPATARVLKQLAELREIDPAPQLPDLADSLQAVRALLTRAGTDSLETAQESGE